MNIFEHLKVEYEYVEHNDNMHPDCIDKITIKHMEVTGEILGRKLLANYFYTEVHDESETTVFIDDYELHDCFFYCLVKEFCEEVYEMD